MMKVRRVRDGSTKSDAEDIDDQEALGLLLRGLAVLDDAQNDPPFALLDALETRVHDLGACGPVTNDPKTLGVIAKNLFSDGMRLNIVDGAQVRWAEGRKGLLGAAARALSQCSEVEQDLFLQARKVRTTYVSTRSMRVTLRGQPSDDKLNRRRLIKGNAGNFLEKTWNYWQLRDDWFEFHSRLEAIDKELSQALRFALGSGRVLCSERFPSGERMLHPDEAAVLFDRSAGRHLSYCFSTDLPNYWLQGEQSLEIKRRNAAKWMEKVIRHFERQGRRATVKDVKIVAREKFSLSENAVQEAWEPVNISDLGQFRNPKAAMRVSINEIKEIE